MAIAQLILFIITNAPALIKAIREIIDIFDGDAKEAKHAIETLTPAFRKAVIDGDIGLLRKLVEKEKKRREAR